MNSKNITKPIVLTLTTLEMILNLLSIFLKYPESILQKIEKTVLNKNDVKTLMPKMMQYLRTASQSKFYSVF